VTYRPVLAIGLASSPNRYWRKTGKWQKLMAIVTVDYDSEWLFIDGSVVKAHQHSTGAATRYDKLKDSYGAAIILACVFIWLPLI